MLIFGVEILFNFKIVVWLFALTLLAACGGSDDAVGCLDIGIRTELTFCTLTEGSDPGMLVNMSAFRENTGASPPTNTFEGSLSLIGEDTGGSFTQHVGSSPASTRQHLPEFDFEFVQDGRDIIPVQRGVILTSHPEWEYILEPGKVWNEASDRGFSRAAIPFALQLKNQNCVHNGVMSFLFKDDGTVSKVAYQISAETCLLFKADMWGLLDASYTPATVTNAAAIKSNYQTEVSSRMPTKPMADLVIDFPTASINLSAFGQGISAEHMTLFGLVVGNVHYVGGCETRHGTYPYCDVMVVPSYSTSKSLFAATALMRLEQKYPGAKDTFMSSHVPECNADGDWSDVTFKNTLDMATGNYISPGPQVDEGNFGPFVTALTHADKIDYACTALPRKVTPGTFWNYHTSDTYALTTAMNGFLQQQQGGAGKDIFTDTIVADLWAPLNISPTAQVSKRTYDDIAQAWGGYGLNLHRDDIAKIAKFLNVDNGVIGTEQMLDIGMLQQALQRVPGENGLYTSVAGLYYNNGFWALEVSSYLGCSNEVWVPEMSGFGGITVALIPNGITYYYFSDNAEFYWVPAVIEANKITSMCLS